MGDPRQSISNPVSAATDLTWASYPLLTVDFAKLTLLRGDVGSAVGDVYPQ